MSISSNLAGTGALSIYLDTSARIKLIAQLTELVLNHETSGVFHRQAVREVAKMTGLHPMTIRRLIDLYPEA
jgi:hypothetical protein